MRRIAGATFAISFSLVLLELSLTRVFGVVLFASFSHLALAIALMGISAGAVLQQVAPGLITADTLESRVGRLAMAQGVLTLLVVAVAVSLPLTVQADEAVLNYVTERLKFKWDLMATGWFALLLPILVTPFTAAGWSLAAIFTHRKEDIGPLYGADLVGGALAGLLFIPLLSMIAAPDMAFASAGAALLGACAVGTGRLRIASGLIAAVCGLAILGSATWGTLLQVRYPAGFSEHHIVWEKWTPLTRLAVHEAPSQTRILLDNSSSSEVVLTSERQAVVAKNMSRGLVYVLHEPPARVAILAASAGPDVATAQHYGFTHIDAIDIAPDIGNLVADRYADAPYNPYRHTGTRRILADARSAVLHSQEPYDIIQLMHANLHGIGGMLANAWSPALLGTKEAFHTYLDRLSEDGTLSFARGSRTPFMAQSAAAALRERGVSEPHRHIAYLANAAPVVLVKRRPFTQEERDRIAKVASKYPRQALIVDPTARLDERAAEVLWGRKAMTDDRPYTDTPSDVLGLFGDAAVRATGQSGAERVKPENVVYYMLLIEALVVGLGGALVLGIPLGVQARRRRVAIRGTWKALLYVSGLGYGYLAIEVVLIHGLSLFVGHPVYALTVVVFTLLLTSGLGSIIAGRIAEHRLLPTLLAALTAVLALGCVQAFAVPPILHSVALGWPIPFRIALTSMVLAPLGFAMGMPFALSLRLLPDDARGLVPWMWALNGWTSVAAALSTVFIARLAGFSYAFAAALLAYLVALIMARALPTVGSGTPDEIAVTGDEGSAVGLGERPSIHP